MTPTRLVLNGKSAGAPGLRAAVEALRAEGHALEVRATWEKGCAARLTREAAREGAARVIAAGGDGTLQEVVDALLRLDPASRPTLGIVPLGTANDFAAAVGLPDAAEPALRVALSEAAVPVDALCVEADGRRWHGINVVTGGFGTEITTDTRDELKKSLGSLAYLLTGIAKMRDFRAVEARIAAPGFAWSGSFLMMAAGNARYAGGRHPVCPDARVDDGLLDLTILPDSGETPAGSVVASMLEWLGGGADAVLDRCVTARVARCTIEAERGLHLNLDGEPLSGSRFTLAAMPDALRVHLPARAAGEPPIRTRS